MIFIITFIFALAVFGIIYLGIKSEKVAAELRWKTRTDLSPEARASLKQAGFPV